VVVPDAVQRGQSVGGGGGGGGGGGDPVGVAVDVLLYLRGRQFGCQRVQRV